MVDLYPALSRIYSLRYIIQIIFRGNQLDSSTIVQVLWKRLNAETSQHGNASKISRNPSKTGFLRRFRNFCKINGNPSKPSF